MTTVENHTADIDFDGPEFDVTAADALDFFTFSDAPVFEKRNLLRTEVTG
jgi:gentisate 1,2-dioxygenase